MIPGECVKSPNTKRKYRSSRTGMAGRHGAVHTFYDPYMEIYTVSQLEIIRYTLSVLFIAQENYINANLQVNVKISFRTKD